LNLSDVDIVGLPLTLQGSSADDGTPFSLGYRRPQQEIVSDIRRRALIGEGPAVVKDCGANRTKVVAPNIQFPFYRRYDEYLDALTTAGASLAIRTDTPLGGIAETFTGGFAPGSYQALPDAQPLVSLTSGSDSFQILKSQFTTELLYRCDGGSVAFNGKAVPQNRPDHAGEDREAVYTNSLFATSASGSTRVTSRQKAPRTARRSLHTTPFGTARATCTPRSSMRPASPTVSPMRTPT
jgi:hypothetical protein